jgi:anion-transporting  ArsA/GET3 family ATPase
VIERWLEGKQVCICAGSGGVGKTTTSAAIALGMAARGGKVAVLTIDPARRLANSLGLSELGNEERQVRAEGLAGELWAMMLDAKRTFDEIVERHAPDERAREAVLSNRIYQELSNAVAGSQEFMAMEKLHELHQEGRYDLLVLDTPPTRNALDFLDAPRRLTEFVDSRTMQLFTAPAGIGLKLLGRGTGVVFSVMKRATGIDLLQDLGDFFRSFAGMTEGFRERAKLVNELLADSRTAFVLVTSPRRHALDEAVWFHERLTEAGMPFAGVIANRVHQGGGESNRAQLEALLGTDLARKVLRTYENERRLAERDRAGLAELRERIGRKPIIEIPHLHDDVHDIDGLSQMDEYLFGRSDRSPAARRAPSSPRARPSPSRPRP